MNRIPLSSLCLLGALGLAAVLAACGNADTPAGEASVSPTATPSACDPVPITAAIEDSYAATSASEGTGLNLQSVSGVQCDAGWAIAIVSIGDGLGHNFDDREVLQRVANEWQVADRMTVCGTANPRRLDSVPQDAQVADSLYFIACQTD